LICKREKKSSIKPIFYITSQVIKRVIFFDAFIGKSSKKLGKKASKKTLRKFLSGF
jgi:hypothetical protein